ncbi:hypothetical protein [Methylomonas koyamae]|uniref:hypothetical protein n=1 Tax=Methylomonas koyamae TaxID=702114 RepID=UPI000AA5C022|nr:hypothetical protein [Methylomonas koyamae]BBL56980.1 hypothetical protein MKFW12EY_05930 [Methylomonas koyamae]
MAKLSNKQIKQLVSFLDAQTLTWNVPSPENAENITSADDFIAFQEYITKHIVKETCALFNLGLKNVEPRKFKKLTPHYKANLYMSMFDEYQNEVLGVMLRPVIKELLTNRFGINPDALICSAVTATEELVSQLGQTPRVYSFDDIENPDDVLSTVMDSSDKTTFDDMPIFALTGWVKQLFKNAEPSAIAA